jgi:hypothetical protein
VMSIQLRDGLTGKRFFPRDPHVRPLIPSGILETYSLLRPEEQDDAQQK